MKPPSIWNALSFVWSLPNTAVGLAFGALSLARPERSHGAINFQLRRGIVLWVCHRIGISAFTMGDCVLYTVPPTSALRVHEGRHVWQYRMLGPLFLPVYFLLMARYGYWDHPLERDARAYEERMLGRVGPSRLK
ncbi:MAG: hypothetical protein H0U67_06740 [Gemmatimonadetes bacterium]|nr:hypothetical protein [Gemmatimonadota bacterium]